MVNCAGDWTQLINQFAISMEFSGHDHVFHQLEGGHVSRWGPTQVGDAMRFLWQGWPEPVKAGPGAPRYQDIALPGEDWQLVAQGRNGTYSGACNSKGEVFFTDENGNQIDRIDLDGKISVFAKNTGNVSSLSVGPNDEIFTSSPQTGKIMVYDTSGKAIAFAEGLPEQGILARPQAASMSPRTDIRNGSTVIRSSMMEPCQTRSVSSGCTNGIRMTMRERKPSVTIGKGISTPPPALEFKFAGIMVPFTLSCHCRPAG